MVKICDHSVTLNWDLQKFIYDILQIQSETEIEQKFRTSKI